MTAKRNDSAKNVLDDVLDFEEHGPQIDSRIYRKVSDLKLNHAVKVCQYSSTLREVVNIFQKTNIGSVVVVDNMKPLGIFTERDYVAKIAGHDLDLNKEIVGTYMTPQPITVMLDDPIIKAMLKMRAGKFRHLLVVNENNIVQNVISVKDMLDFLLKGMETELDFLLE